MPLLSGVVFPPLSTRLTPPLLIQIILSQAFPDLHIIATYRYTIISLFTFTLYECMFVFV